MDDARIAGLKRKYAATEEPAKRNELANKLRAAGVDPDKAQDKPAPEGRKAPEKVTADATKPDAKAATEKAEKEDDSAAKSTAASRKAGRPSRPSGSK